MKLLDELGEIKGSSCCIAISDSTFVQRELFKMYAQTGRTPMSGAGSPPPQAPARSQSARIRGPPSVTVFESASGDPRAVLASSGGMPTVVTPARKPGTTPGSPIQSPVQGVRYEQVNTGQLASCRSSPAEEEPFSMLRVTRVETLNPSDMFASGDNANGLSALRVDTVANATSKVAAETMREDISDIEDGNDEEVPDSDSDVDSDVLPSCPPKGSLYSIKRPMVSTSVHVESGPVLVHGPLSIVAAPSRGRSAVSRISKPIWVGGQNKVVLHRPRSALALAAEQRHWEAEERRTNCSSAEHRKGSRQERKMSGKGRMHKLEHMAGGRRTAMSAGPTRLQGIVRGGHISAPKRAASAASFRQPGKESIPVSFSEFSPSTKFVGDMTADRDEADLELILQKKLRSKGKYHLAS